MNCLRNWARYMHKGEVKGRGIKNGNESASWILLLDSPFRIITISVGTSQRRYAPITKFSQPII